MRRLDGGSAELSSVIVRSMQAAFPGNEFFLDAIDPDTYVVYWRHASGPADPDVLEFLNRRWGQFTFTCHDSEGHTFAGQTGGARPIPLSPPSAADPPPDPRKLLQSLNISGSSKTCNRCQATSPLNRKVCTSCGHPFPRCVICGRLTRPDEKHCGGCGCLNKYASRTISA